MSIPGRVCGFCGTRHGGKWLGLTNCWAAKQSGVGNGRVNGWFNSRTELRNGGWTKEQNSREKSCLPFDDSSNLRISRSRLGTEQERE